MKFPQHLLEDIYSREILKESDMIISRMSRDDERILEKIIEDTISKITSLIEVRDENHARQLISSLSSKFSQISPDKIYFSVFKNEKLRDS